MNSMNDVKQPLFIHEPSLKRANPFTATRTFIWRTIQHTKNNLFGYAIEAIIAPAIMLLIFNYLFGGAVAGSTGAYIQFLLPGILIFTVVPLTVYSGTTISLDITKGVYHRFRTMPFWQPASILGPLITDGMRYAIALLSALAAGLLIGFRPAGGMSGVALALLFIVFFAFSVSWIFSLIGVIVKRPETVSGTSMIFVYPFLFASNILVDSATMPKWIQVVIDLNPISIAASTARELMSGTAGTADIASGMTVCVLLIVVFAPLTMYFYLVKKK